MIGSNDSEHLRHDQIYQIEKIWGPNSRIYPSNAPISVKLAVISVISAIFEHSGIVWPLDAL